MNARNVYGIVNTIMRQWAGWSGTVRDGEIFIRTKAQKRPQAGRSVRETGYMQQHVSGLITDCDRSPAFFSALKLLEHLPSGICRSGQIPEEKEKARGCVQRSSAFGW